MNRKRLPNEMFDLRKQVRMPEDETFGKQFAGHHTPALDQKFDFGAHKKRPNL